MLTIRCRLKVIAFAGMLAGPWVGCSPEQREATSAQAQPAQTVVARVGDRRITLEMLEGELALRAGSRSSAERRERVLQELVDREALVLRAREAGFDAQPQVQAQVNRLLAALWQEEELGRHQAEPATVTDDEVATFYRANPQEFRQAGAVRAGVILFAVGPNASADHRAEVQTRAREVRERAVQVDEMTFRQLVQQHSDDQSTRYVGGDTGWIEDGQQVWRWDAAIVDAARGLGQRGDVAEVIESPVGFHVVRLLDRRAAAPRPLEQVADSIRYRLMRQRQADQQAAFINQVKQGLEIEINHSLLQSLPISADSQAPPVLPGG